MVTGVYYIVNMCAFFSENMGRKRKQPARISLKEEKSDDKSTGGKKLKKSKDEKVRLDSQAPSSSDPPDVAEPSCSTSSSVAKVPLEFFQKKCEDLARALLGKMLVRILPSTGERLSGMIVETEAYLGGEDKAAHSCDGKKTERNAAMFMDPGTIYVYHIYGTYTCINVSSQGWCRKSRRMNKFIMFVETIL